MPIAIFRAKLQQSRSLTDILIRHLLISIKNDIQKAICELVINRFEADSGCAFQSFLKNAILLQMLSASVGRRRHLAKSSVSLQKDFLFHPG